MKMDLGCYVEVLGFKVKNTHNSIMNNFATKTLLVEMNAWPSGLETEILREDLIDSRGQVCIEFEMKKLNKDHNHSNAMSSWKSLISHILILA